MKKISILMATVASLGLTACAQPNMNSNVYTPSAAMRAQQVNMGTIIAVRQVEIRNIQGNSDAMLGALAGGAAGALIGDQFGKGRGNTLMTGIGAVAGAAAGSNVAQNVNRMPAQEWTVRLNTGQTIAVVQNDTHLFVGQNVRVVNDGRQTRIVY